MYSITDDGKEISRQLEKVLPFSVRERAYKAVIEILQYDINEYDKYDDEEASIIFEDRMACDAGIKALNSILKIREYAEKTKNSELREMLRLD